MSLGMALDLGPGDFVLDGDPVANSPKSGGQTPQIFGPCLLWPNGWMDEAGTWHGGMPQPRRLCVRWGPSTTRKRGRSPSPIFGPFLLWPNAWMHQDATWYGCRPQPRDFVLVGEPVPPPRQGGGAPRNFRPMFIVVKRLDGSKCNLV